jgi:hypothetical protein
MISTQLPWILRLSLITLVIFGWRKNDIKLRQPYVREAILQGDDQWLLYLNTGEAIPATLLSGSYVQLWLTVLNFELDSGKHCTLLLTGDNIDPIVFRRLRVRLRMPIRATRSSTLLKP